MNLEARPTPGGPDIHRLRPHPCICFFSHIFYPMTNITAEKHDGFIITSPEGNAITEGVFAVLQELMQKHGNVVFGGDGYSAEWHKMAVEERGLKNIPTTAGYVLLASGMAWRASVLKFRKA